MGCGSHFPAGRFAAFFFASTRRTQGVEALEQLLVEVLDDEQLFWPGLG